MTTPVEEAAYIVLDEADRRRGMYEGLPPEIGADVAARYADLMRERASCSPAERAALLAAVLAANEAVDRAVLSDLQDVWRRFFAALDDGVRS